ncbi:MAG: hypothetical protein ACI8UO_004507 [Verrucomicrobiales bacterium]|jgi:hypothetical protein
MKTMFVALSGLAIALITPVLAMVSVASVESLDKMPDHLKFRTSPSENEGLINVWVTIIEPEPEHAGVWASLSTRSPDGKLLSNASVASHKKEDGFTLSFQVAPESFDTSSIMIAVRGKNLEDVGYEVSLALFKPEADEKAEN